MIKSNDTVTVVLTAFKRADMLKKQLEAIKNQSVKPDEILLFQDKIPKDYIISIDDSILGSFDGVCIAKENIGVWGRFDYARQAQSEYVCIFDDDTIPGNRWIENCLGQMHINPGIYGTIGIVVGKNNQYPYNGFYRIGWDRPNSKTREVDFVGHSWFIKKEWLAYMFDGTEKFQKFKYAAEDMCLSFACQKHGIKSYVPPHPRNRKDMWGSMPEIAAIAGVNSALSMSSENNKRMYQAMRLMIKEGWKSLYIREPGLVGKEIRQAKIVDGIALAKRGFRLIRKQKYN